MGDTTENVVLWVLLVVGATILVLVGAWYNQWRRRHVAIPDTLESARQQFANLMSERIGVAMRAGELDAIIVERWNEWPLAYRPALYQMLRHAQLLEETMYIEAVAQGIYPKRLFEGDLEQPPPTLPTRAERSEAEQAAAAEPSVLSNVVPIKGGRALYEWVDGQLLKLTS